MQKYLFCLGLECLHVIGWNTSRGCLTIPLNGERQNLYGNGGRNVIWTEFLHKRLFTY